MTSRSPWERIEAPKERGSEAPMEDRIRVAHLQQEEGIIVCHPSPMANPYRHKKDWSRAERIEAFRKGLEKEMRTRDGLRYRWMRTLAKRLALSSSSVVLTCWCAPKPCHGDIIRECILQLVREMQEGKG